MSVLNRNGASLAYEIHGGGTKPPLLLTHGYGASQAMWAANVGALSAERRVLTWDLRGHGETRAADAEHTADETIADMIALLDVLEVQRAIVGGMSLGGYLSLLLNVRHPQRVDGLLLVDTGPGFRNDQARDGWNAWAEDLADALDSRGLEALPPGREQPAAHADGPAGLARAARGILTQRDADVIDSLRTVDVPTLVIVGAQDEPFEASAEVMAQRIPGARKLVLDDAGHAANMDRPDAFNAAVLEAF